MKGMKNENEGKNTNTEETKIEDSKESAKVDKKYAPKIEITKLTKGKICVMIEGKQVNFTDRITVIPYSDEANEVLKSKKYIKIKIL